MKRFALLALLMLGGCVGKQTVPLVEYNAIKEEAEYFRSKAEGLSGGETFLEQAYFEMKAKYDACASFHKSWERGLREAEKRTDK